MKLFTEKSLRIALVVLAIGALTVMGAQYGFLDASSHREAPMILNDPFADNTDLYAFRTPEKSEADTHSVTIIANYVPFAQSNQGPNYHTFGENIRYEIHVKNDPKTKGDDIVYRFTFTWENQDPSTFFRIRLGKENLHAHYKCERSMDGGKSFHTIISLGTVPPPNIGPRSIESEVGLNTSYPSIVNKFIKRASTGETVFCGPVDDPFFADLGGIFDLANIRPESAVDALKCHNVMAIAIKVPIKTLQKDRKSVHKAKNILDSDYVIGVWASASRPKVRVLAGNGMEEGGNENGGTKNRDVKETYSGPWIQVSRLGMPLTNEVIIPLGYKDYWNSVRPYNEDPLFEDYFVNPELALYMDESKFGGAVPGLAPLRIQSNSLQQFDFRNEANGLAGLLGNPATEGTAFDTDLFGNYLLRSGKPRSVDLLPIFMTGVPNLPPYQLATGKGGNPLAKGKPFVNNFLPTFGDMLRLNMAVPPTPRNDPNFSSLGLLQAAVLGLTDPEYNSDTDIEFIPNMDGFPNGRRLEDDVTRIELQAVGGVVLAAIGLWYDDYTAGDANPVTQDLLDVLSFTTGVESNDVPFKEDFPFLANPPSGFDLPCDNSTPAPSGGTNFQGMNSAELNLAAPKAFMKNFPNPASDLTTFKYRVAEEGEISLRIYDANGTLIAAPINKEWKKAGTYEMEISVKDLKKGIYYVTMDSGNKRVQSLKLVVD